MGGCDICTSDEGCICECVIVVCRVPVVSGPQRKEAIRVLQRIGTQTGIKFARDYASNPTTIMLEAFKPLLNC